MCEACVADLYPVVRIRFSSADIGHMHIRQLYQKLTDKTNIEKML